MNSEGTLSKQPGSGRMLEWLLGPSWVWSGVVSEVRHQGRLVMFLWLIFPLETWLLQRVTEATTSADVMAPLLVVIGKAVCFALLAVCVQSALRALAGRGRQGTTDDRKGRTVMEPVLLSGPLIFVFWLICNAMWTATTVIFLVFGSPGEVDIIPAITALLPTGRLFSGYPYGFVAVSLASAIYLSVGLICVLPIANLMAAPRKGGEVSTTHSVEPRLSVQGATVSRLQVLVCAAAFCFGNGAMSFLFLTPYS